MQASDEHDGSADAWAPTVVVPEDLTPLPDVDRALPVLGLFAALLGRRHERFKVAILSELARQPRGRWKIREIQGTVSWLEPSSTTRLVADLRNAELLLYDSARDSYRLSHEARVVAAVCGALTVPEVSLGRIIKILASTMALAQATGAPEEAVLAPFLSAIAILESDREHLAQLIDDRSEQALLEAAELAQLHVADMQDLLEEQQEVFARFADDPSFLVHDQRAHNLIAQVGRLAAEVVSALSERADELMRGGLRFDRQDLRDLVASLGLEELAPIAAGATLPPAVPPADPDVAFAALDDYLSRAERVPTEVPEPIKLEPEPPADPGPDAVDDAATALRELAAAGGGPLTDWLVADDWDGAVSRLSAVVEAWSRHGPTGTDQLTLAVVARSAVELVQRGGVARLSRTDVEPDGGGRAGDRSREDATAMGGTE